MSVQQIAKEDETHKGSSGVRHEMSKPESGPIVDNFTMTRRWSADGKEYEDIFGTANVTVDTDGSWNYSGQMIPY